MTPTRSRLGNLPCNPAPRIYKGGRGTPLRDNPTHPNIRSPDHPTIASSNPRALLSTGIIQPQTGRRVLPPPEGPNLSKTLRPISSVLCYHHTCDPTTHHMNLIAGNKHRHAGAAPQPLSQACAQAPRQPQLR